MPQQSSDKEPWARATAKGSSASSELDPELDEDTVRRDLRGCNCGMFILWHNHVYFVREYACLRVHSLCQAVLVFSDFLQTPTRGGGSKTNLANAKFRIK